MKSCMYSSPDINYNEHIEGDGQGKLRARARKIKPKHKNSRNTRRKGIICKIKAFMIG